MFAPFAPPFVFRIRGRISWYTFGNDVTSVGQNDVTPWANKPFATFSIPSSTCVVLLVKSMPKPPVKIRH